MQERKRLLLSKYFEPDSFVADLANHLIKPKKEVVT
jgi:hypothetical protein